MYVCMYVCVCVCVFVCDLFVQSAANFCYSFSTVCVCVYIYVCVCVCVCLYVCFVCERRHTLLMSRRLKSDQSECVCECER